MEKLTLIIEAAQPFIILLLAVLLGAYNGQFITGASKSWHGTGFLIRALLIVFLWPDITLMLIYFWLAWPVYDIIINMYMRVKWNYVGTTSAFDRMPGCVLALGKILLTFGMIAAILVNWLGL